MPLDPNAQFDQATMEMIEHSPTGAVPHTPTYQDALKRLYAAHQVYPDADHRDGHVTARSLSGLPGFRAANLGDLAAGKIQPEAVEANANIFDNYVRSLKPELRAKAEGSRQTVAGRPAMHRAKHAGSEKLPVAHDLVHSLFLVPGAGPHPGLPGNYLYGFIMQVAADATHGSWAVHLHDREDGSAEFRAQTVGEAVEKLQELLDSAPFTMAELGALGFRQT
jgi:hypothetical protein